MSHVKVAVVQMDPKLGEIDKNLTKTLSFVEEATKEAANLIVFPECSLTGYCFNSKEQAMASALSVGDVWNDRLIEAANKTNSHIIVGFAEKSAGKLYNSALVIGPRGNLGVYRKSHLSQLGVDNFVTRGEGPYELIETDFGKIGLLICYDVRFPEQARVLSLEGADVLVHLTNLPLTASSQVDFLLPARANENRVYVLSSDRVGIEEGFSFLGRSTIYDLEGNVISQANNVDEVIIYSELDFKASREKEVFYPAVEGKPIDHINALFKSRRPELYVSIIKQ